MADSIVMTILNNKVALDNECWNCDGGRCVRHNNDGLWTNGVCDICKGIGYELTEAGEAIIQLINRHKGSV